MHNFIGSLLGGKLTDTERDWFRGTDAIESIDPTGYAHYLPTFCDFLKRSTTWEDHEEFTLPILNGLAPMELSLEQANRLVDVLAKRQVYEIVIGIVDILAIRTLPLGTETDNLWSIVNDGFLFAYPKAAAVLARIPESTINDHFFDLLRRYPREREIDIANVIIGLGETGDIAVIPAMVASVGHREWWDVCNAIVFAIEKICRRHGVSEALEEKFKDLFFWRPQWPGTREEFVAYAMRCASTVYGVAEDESMELLDQIGTVFCRELHMDIKPFATFRELRISTNVDLEEIPKAAIDKLQSDQLLLAGLEGTDITVDGLTAEEAALCKDFLDGYYIHRLAKYFKPIVDVDSQQR